MIGSESSGESSFGIRESVTMVARSLRHMMRKIDALLISIILPVMMMLLFVFIFGGAIQAGGGYINYVVPGILLLSVGYGASLTAVSVNEDMTKGIIDRFRTMPIHHTAILTGHVVASLLRNSISVGLVLVVALLLGFRPDATIADWALAWGILLLYMLAITWLAVGFGLLVKSAEAAGVFGFFMLFVPYLSSAFVPVETMPGFLQSVAQVQPITPAIEAIRGLLTGTPEMSAIWLALLWWGVIALGGFVGRGGCLRVLLSDRLLKIVQPGVRYYAVVLQATYHNARMQVNFLRE